MMTKQAASQGLWFIGVYGFVWIPYYAFQLMDYSPRAKVPLWLGVLHLITMPMQGMLNSFVFFRPKYLADRESYPNDTRVGSLSRVLRIPMIQCKCCKANARHTSSEK